MVVIPVVVFVLNLEETWCKGYGVKDSGNCEQLA